MPRRYRSQGQIIDRPLIVTAASLAPWLDAGFTVAGSGDKHQPGAGRCRGRLVEINVGQVRGLACFRCYQLYGIRPPARMIIGRDRARFVTCSDKLTKASRAAMIKDAQAISYKTFRNTCYVLEAPDGDGVSLGQIEGITFWRSQCDGRSVWYYDLAGVQYIFARADKRPQTDDQKGDRTNVTLYQG